MAKPAHYRGDYPARAQRVRDAAYADPSTRCWQCGRTAAEHGRKWHAGHEHDGIATSRLLPECEGCNTSRGAAMGNRRRRGLVTTREW